MSHQTTRKQSSTMLDAERSDSRNMFLTRKQVVSVEESPPALGPCSDSSNGSNSEELEFDRESLPATISRMRVTPLPSRIPSDLSASSEGNSNVKNDLEVAMVVKNDAPSPKGKRKKVRFDTITIRCMRLIAGDHPSCMEGPSLTVDWKPIQEVTLPIDYYEQRRLTPRSESEMRLCGLDRRRLLKSTGESDERIRESQRESRKVRQQREKTNARSKFDTLEQFQQLLVRKIGRTFHPKVVLKTKY